MDTHLIFSPIVLALSLTFCTPLLMYIARGSSGVNETVEIFKENEPIFWPPFFEEKIKNSLNRRKKYLQEGVKKLIDKVR